MRYGDLLARLDDLGDSGTDPERLAELRRLIDRAWKLDARGDRFAAEGPVERMSFDRVPVLR